MCLAALYSSYLGPYRNSMGSNGDWLVLFCLMLFSLCQCYGYLRHADPSLSADHVTQHEMTITTKAKYDSKCHGVILPCDRDATSDHVNLVSLHSGQTT